MLQLRSHSNRRIARALVMPPALVLPDEPADNLDTQSANNVFDLLREVSSGGTTFLIVTHDPRLAARCDRLIEMVDGRIESDTATPVAVASAGALITIRVFEGAFMTCPLLLSAERQFSGSSLRQG